MKVSGGGHNYARSGDANSPFVNQASWERPPTSSAQGSKRTGDRTYGSIWSECAYLTALPYCGCWREVSTTIASEKLYHLKTKSRKRVIGGCILHVLQFVFCFHFIDSPSRYLFFIFLIVAGQYFQTQNISFQCFVLLLHVWYVWLDSNEHN